MSFDFPVSRGISNGIIKFLMNTSFASLVTVTSRGQLYPERPPSLLLKNDFFYTEQNDNSGQWVLFDFNTNRIDFNGYSIMSNDSYESPCNWRIDVSNNNITWQNADTKNGENTYNPGKIYSTPTKKYFRYVKFTQTGLSVDNRNYVRIDRIDFFGSIYSHTCFYSMRFKNYKTIPPFLSFLNILLC